MIQIALALILGAVGADTSPPANPSAKAVGADTSPPADPSAKSEDFAYRACGVNCLYAVMAMAGMDTDLNRVRGLLKPRPDGRNSLAEMEAAARQAGFHPVGGRLGPDKLGLVPVPSVLHMKVLPGQPAGNHFVVYLGQTEKGHPVLLDAPNPPAALARGKFETLWTGNFLAPCRSETEASGLLTALGQASGTWWSDPLLWTAGVLISALWFVASRRTPQRTLAITR